MTDKTAFSQQEWRVIRSTPLVAGLAVARATPSGMRGAIDELRTLIGDIGRSVPGLTDTPLLQAILDDHPRWHLARITGSDTADPVAMLADATESCAEASALLGERATGEESEQFRAWVVSIARSVAGACREDGESTTEEELATIASIDAALVGN